MASIAATLPVTRLAGGAFLVEPITPDDCFFPEDFTDEQQQILQMTADFAKDEVLPQIDAIEAKDFSVTRRLFKHAANLGLTAVDIPEEYGGLELDRVTSAMICEKISVNGSFSTAFSAHTGIGTLPLVWYGTDAQKRKYLPRLADGNLIAAYALSEASSGSDALNAGARAVISDDGQTYTLNGEKMWITNGGFADLFTIFAKCRISEGKDAGKEKLTAFLVERGTPGFSSGVEEHKMGIRGSSTTALILADCRIPADNLLGEVGKGHRIAFNILNVGRYKLGHAVLGSSKKAFNDALGYARERKAFGRSISEFGLIREKLANMATSIFVSESICYRTVGMIDRALASGNPHDTGEVQACIENYAVECSIVKVFASEALDFVADETVQIFGGYGYVEEFPAERAYRDARINRIFEGTNEINRLIITGMLLKSAASGKLELNKAIELTMSESMGETPEFEKRGGALGAAYNLLARARRLTHFAAGEAMKCHAEKLAEEQELMGALADMAIAVYAMESAILRADKMASTRGGPVAAAMARIYTEDSFCRVEQRGRTVVAATSQNGRAASQFAALRRLAEHDPEDTVKLRREIAEHVLSAGKYAV